MSCGLLLVVVGQQARRHLGDRRSARPQRAVAARGREPPGEVPSVEQRDEALVIGLLGSTFRHVGRRGCDWCLLLMEVAVLGWLGVWVWSAQLARRASASCEAVPGSAV